MKSYRLMWYTLSFCILIALDRITKWMALVYCMHQDYTAIPHVEFTLVWNRGISCGLLSTLQAPYTLMLVALIIVTVMGFAWHTITRARAHHMLCGEIFVLAGALSNLLDRYFYGAVIDMIHLTWPLSWPVFNIADMLIVMGVGLMFFQHIGES